MTIAVMPGLFVSVIATRRKEFVENLGEIAFETRLKFDCADHTRTSDVEHMSGAGRDPALGNDRGDLGRDIVHVTMAAGFDLKFLLNDHNLLSGSATRRNGNSQTLP